MNPINILASIALVTIGGLSELHASTRVGNGGGVLVCTDPVSQKQTVTLIDLYEGRERYGLNIPESNKPYQQQIADALKKIDDSGAHLGIDIDNISKISFSYLLTGFIDRTQKFRFIREDQKLQLIDDSTFLILPRNCDKQQLAISTNSYEPPLVDPILFRQLNETNKAAFILHEAIYALFLDHNRLSMKFDSVSSDATRKSVGYLFSNTQLSPVLTKFSEPTYYCKTTGEGAPHQFNRFYVSSENDKIIIEFVRILGEVILTNTRVVFRADNIHTFQGNWAVLTGATSIMLRQNPNQSREDDISVELYLNYMPGMTAQEIAANITALGVNVLVGSWYQGPAKTSCFQIQ